MKTKQELKPCPFCGSDRLEKGSTVGINGRLRWIACKKCGASSGLKNEAITDAIAAWNLRFAKALENGTQ
jgi:Lar family restriction alleviation protein